MIYNNHCYGLNVPSPHQNSYVEILPHPNEVVLGGGDFGRWLALDEVTRVKRYEWNLCLMRIMKKPASLLCSLSYEGTRSHQSAN